jgi:hypothetical protein
VSAVAWSIAAYAAYRIVRRLPQSRGQAAAALVGAAVFSHWLLDFVVHRPDLPLYDNTAKVGLGLWNVPAAALGLEAMLLFGGIFLFLQDRATSKVGLLIFGVVMLAIQVYVFFGPPPPSDRAAAMTALLAYAIFAAFVAWWDSGSKTPRASL